jgi:hypothetical protein
MQNTKNISTILNKVLIFFLMSTHPSIWIDVKQTKRKHDKANKLETQVILGIQFEQIGMKHRLLVQCKH